ncbi:MAG: hypothetical protein V7L29_34405 [Nostoc sp.]
MAACKRDLTGKVRLTDAYGGLRQRREPPLNASSLKWGNPTNGLARLCAIYAPAVLVQEGL